MHLVLFLLIVALVAWIKMLQNTHIDQMKSAMNEWMDVYI